MSQFHKDMRGKIKDPGIELHQAISTQTKWLAALVRGVAGLALTIDKLL